jgi:hypothetical protein
LAPIVAPFSAIRLPMEIPVADHPAERRALAADATSTLSQV